MWTHINRIHLSTDAQTATTHLLQDSQNCFGSDFDALTQFETTSTHKEANHAGTSGIASAGTSGIASSEVDASMKALPGFVKWYNHKNGYGFVCPTGTKDEIFLHHSSLLNHDAVKYLKEGQPVRFTTVTAKKGPRAKDVFVELTEDQEKNLLEKKIKK